MSSLNGYYSPLVGFFSYSRDDDASFRGALSTLREAIEGELSAQLGRSPRNFQIWQDRADIPYGDEWQKQITLGIGKSVFFIPVITPRVVNSDNCELEFTSFLAREKELGRDDLIFPILYIPVPELDDDTLCSRDPVLSIVRARQWFDFREQRHRDPRSGAAAEQIENFCRIISTKLRRQWESPEERREREQAEVARTAEQARQLDAAKLTAERNAQEQEARRQEEERQREAERRDAEQRAQAEGERQKREAAAREAARLEAQQRADAERQRILEQRRTEQTTAERRATQEWAFASAKKTGTAAAIDSFLTTHPDSHLAEQADRLKTELLVRQEAFERAVASGEPPVLRAFLATYPSGSDANRVRARLLLLETRRGWKSRPAMAVAAAVVLLCLSAVAYRFGNASGVTGSPPPLHQASLAPAAPQPEPPPSWAACGPNPAPTTAPMGDGGFQGAPIKIALTKAQRDVIAVRTLAISPDGRTLVSGGDDAIIRFWDAANLKLIRAISGGHSAAIYSVAFSSDGKFLASASFDGTVQIWDAHAFAHVNTFDTAQFAGRVKVQQFAVAFEPVNDPRYVDSTGADGTVWIWDLRSGQLAANPRSSSSTVDARVGSLGFAPDGSGSYATANFDGTIKFVDPGRSDVIAAFPGKALRLAYSPNGALVASAGADAPGKISGVKIWDAASHALFKALPAHRGHGASVAWSRDGTRLATGGGFADPSVALWDVQSGRQVPQFDGHTADVDSKDYDSKDVEAVVFHPHRNWLISASEAGRIKIWNAATGKELLSIVAIPGGDDYVAYAPTGCYTGSANAANYVRYVTKFGDRTGTALLVPNGAADFLLPQ